MNSPADISILVVDDDDGGRYAKTRTLQKEGYSVSEAALAQTAIDLVITAPPDLVLLDIRLPDGNGVEVCRTIKASFPQVAVLQTSSALISAQDRTRSLEAGADSYLIEPIEPDELIAVIRALLRMRRAEQALRQMNETLEARVVERTTELAQSYKLLMSERAGRREAENVLWHAQKLEAVGRLTGGMAHDFNNLLTVITGNLDLLQSAVSGERQQSPERQLHLISAALRAAEHGAQMTQQLLTFARRGVLQSKTVDLNVVIAGMGEFLQRTVGDAITFEFSMTPRLWDCTIDPVQFEAAILNLVINARDAMPEGGKLRIELRNVDPRNAVLDKISPGDYVCVRVIDTGFGMTDDVIERVFEPFFTTKDIGEGSGLGLSQVHGFINQSGGDVQIKSTPGTGTTISLYLPRSHVPAVKNINDRDITHKALEGEETVLVVEDEKLVRDVAVEMIRDLGYRVLVAADGHEALTLMTVGPPVDLLFSDVSMPGGISGVTLAVQAREIQKGIKILLTSGYPAKEGVSHGLTEFPLLQKPYRRDTLALMIRSVLDLGHQTPTAKDAGA